MKIAKYIVAIGAVLALLSGCDAFEKKDKGYSELQAIEKKWEDAVAVAGSTGRIALAQPVSNLQSIRRELEGVKLGKCLMAAKPAYEEHMDLLINAMLQFMSHHEAMSDQLIDEAKESAKKYQKLKAECIQ